MKKPSATDFCRAIAALSRGRRHPWWVSIGAVAARLDVAPEVAIELAIACEREQLVTHDLASFESRHERRTKGRSLLPHSVSLIGGGHGVATPGGRR